MLNKITYKQLLIGTICSFFICEGFAQNNKKSLKSYPNYLLINVQKVIKRDSCEIIDAKKKKTTIIYDKKDSYYHYQFVDKTQWHAYEQYSLKISSNLNFGYIYIFIVDARNTPQILQTISLDSVGTSKNINFPCSDRNLLLRHAGIEHLAIWFSKSPLIDYKIRTEGIEMTVGTFLSRNKRQIGSSFGKLNGQWFFSKRRIGFHAANSFYDIKNSFIIPLLIDFQIKSKLS